MLALTFSCAAVIVLLLAGLTLLAVPALAVILALTAACLTLLVKALLLPFRLLNFLPAAAVLLLLLFLF